MTKVKWWPTFGDRDFCKRLASSALNKGSCPKGKVLLLLLCHIWLFLKICQYKYQFSTPEPPYYVNHTSKIDDISILFSKLLQSDCQGHNQVEPMHGGPCNLYGKYHIKSQSITLNHNSKSIFHWKEPIFKLPLKMKNHCL